MTNYYCTLFPTNLTNMNRLPIGTKFYVHNGMWYGEIIKENKTKYIKTSQNIFEITNDIKLEITILT